MGMQKCFAVLIIFLVAGNALAKEANPPVSLGYSCSHKPFLSVSISTQRSDSFPDVQVRLIDPLGRALSSHENNRIPKFRQGRIIEIPGHAATSKAVAIEICGAKPGDYAVVVSERANDQYRLAVRADNGGTGNEGMASSFRSRRGRTCTYRVRFRMVDHIVNVRWLSSTEHSQTLSPEPACELTATR